MKQTAEKQGTEVIEILIGVLFLIAPFFSWPNGGGQGLELPFNYGVWGTVSLIILYTVITVLKKNELVLPKHYLTILAFPTLIFVSGALSGVISPIEWFFRQLYIIVGVVFLFSLFQFKDKLNPERTLIIVVLSTLFHTIISILQITESTLMAGWYPQDLREPMAIGMFQHVNLQATYLSTGIVAAFYLLTRANVNQTIIIKMFLIFTIGLASYMMIATGSRVAILGLIIGLLLLALSSFKLVKKNAAWILIACVVMGGAGHLAKNDLGSTIDKSAKLIEGEYSAARLSIYAISFEAIKDSPVYGHGIGGFLKAWNDNAAAFYSENKNAAMPNYITHPHNEILFWLIEGGVIALLGIMSAFIAVCISVYRWGWSHGSALLALIIPIALHTQVELPFYISSIHWFLWLLFIYFILSESKVKVSLNLSQAATYSIKYGAVGLFALSIYSLYYTAKAQQEIFRFETTNQKPVKLERALTNLYSIPTAEKIAMRTQLYSNLDTGNERKIIPSIRWAEEYIKIKPELKIYEDIINGYSALRMHKEVCITIQKALNHYPANKALQGFINQCSQN